LTLGLSGLKGLSGLIGLKGLKGLKGLSGTNTLAIRPEWHLQLMMELDIFKYGLEATLFMECLERTNF
jgi:hypothetical protein